jgi:hypothetical protein
VKREFFAKNERLKRYRNVVWDSIELFNAFAIKVVPRDSNVKVDALSSSNNNPSTM